MGSYHLVLQYMIYLVKMAYHEPHSFLVNIVCEWLLGIFLSTCIVDLNVNMHKQFWNGLVNCNFKNCHFIMYITALFYGKCVKTPEFMILFNWFNYQSYHQKCPKAHILHNSGCVSNVSRFDIQPNSSYLCSSKWVISSLNICEMK